MSQPRPFRRKKGPARDLAAVGGAPADPVAGLPGEFPLFAALLTSSWRQLASWGFENPVVHAFAHHLQRFSLGHSGVFPLDFISARGRNRLFATKRPWTLRECSRTDRRFQWPV